MAAALLRELVRTLRAEGRTTLIVDATEGGPADSCAEHLGLPVALRASELRLDMSTVDILEGYRLERWVNGAPDAPTEDLEYEDPLWTVKTTRGRAEAPRPGASMSGWASTRSAGGTCDRDRSRI